jgi:hypothetical protein
MKLIVFSDTHGDEISFLKMLKHESYDQLYCLGDSGFSKEYLDQYKIISVKGNYPFSPKNPYDISEKIEGRWFFFTHGHLYHVKYGLSRLKQKANLLRMDVCGFGHTHQFYLEKEGDLIIFNPGALSQTRSHMFPSYARIHISPQKIRIEIINLMDFKTVKTYQEDAHE